jgi:putative phosphoribosyl transferase
MFRDRKDGGKQLAKALEKYQHQNVLVLGIPRGGVETAYYVAQHLHAKFSFIVSRKLGYPYNPEAAFGALAEDGSYFIFESAERELSPEVIQSAVETVKHEIKRRIDVMRAGRPLPNIKNKTVILVDDGVATGATLFAAINLCKNQKAERIIVAAPIAGKEMIEILKSKVDDVVILLTPDFYHAVSQGYQTFHDLDDDDVLEIMNQWKVEKRMEEEIV